jgi:cation diffusion facilitator CzcD-associated flavoprotein CzcO
VIRWQKALTTQAFYRLCQRRPELAKRLLRKGIERQLPEGYDIDTHFTPRYDPWDQRLCVVPNADLFKAIRAERASVVTDHISTFTESGIELQSGEHLDADIIVSATGLELLFIGGIELTVDGEPLDVAEKLTYKGMMLEGVPNLAIAVGYTNASWTLKCDLTCRYVTQLLNHLRATGLRQCTPVNSDPEVTASPLLGLSSGYVQRSKDKFPKQGSRFPWQVHQSYLRDYRALRLAGIHDDAMTFSNPATAATAEPAAVAS